MNTSAGTIFEQPEWADLEAMEVQRKNNNLLRYKILDRRADSDEVLEWFFGNDPLDEASQLQHLIGEEGADDRLIATEVRSYLNDIQALSLGGAQLGLSVIHPEFFGDDDNPTVSWIGEADSYFMCVYEDIVDTPDGDLSADDMTYVIAKELQGWLEAHDGELSEDQSFRLSVAADMMQLAARNFQPIQRLHIDNGPKHGIDVSRNELATQTAVSVMIYDVIARQGFVDTVSTGVRLNACKSLGMLSQLGHIELSSMEAFIEAGGSSFEMFEELFLLTSGRTSMLRTLFEDGSNTQIDEARAFLLGSYIDIIDEIFLGKNKAGLLYQQKPELKDAKGVLYESLWLLDFNMLQMIRKDHTVIAMPATSFEDAPRVGHPKLRRGIDITLYCNNDGPKEWIQLKSSETAAKRGKSYHPFIRQVVEKNFMDAEPRRLASKLQTYRRYLTAEIKQDGTVSPEDLERKYVLDTVIAEYEAMSEKKGVDHFGTMGKIAIHYLGRLPIFDHPDVALQQSPQVANDLGLNRKQRRAKAKAARRVH